VKDELEALPPRSRGDVSPGRDDIPESAPPRRNIPWRRLAAGGAGLVVVVGLVGVAVHRPAPTAADRVAAVRDFIEDARHGHFAMSVLEDVPSRDEMFNRFEVDGDLSVPGRLRWNRTWGNARDETVISPDGVYERGGVDISTGDALDGSPRRWTFTSTAKAEARARDRYTPATYQTAAPLVSWLSPSDLSRMLGRLREPEWAGPGRAKVNAQLSLTDLLPGQDGDIAEILDDIEGGVTVELTAGPEGRLDRLLWKVTMTARPGSALADGTSSYGPFEDYGLTADVRFTRWGDAVDIAAPARERIDPTPSLDEDSLTGVDFVTLLVPRKLPAGFELASGSVAFDDVIEILDGVRQPDCSTATLSWEHRSAPKGPFDIVYVPATCVPGVFPVQSPGEPFQVGPYPGTITRPVDDYPFTGFELTVGDTRLNVISGLSEAETVAALSELVPLDLAAHPIQRNLPGTAS
jgi:hypothetical protein